MWPTSGWSRPWTSRPFTTTPPPKGSSGQGRATPRLRLDRPGAPGRAAAHDRRQSRLPAAAQQHPQAADRPARVARRRWWRRRVVTTAASAAVDADAVVGYNASVATAEYTYSYLAPSAVKEENGRAEVSLATSGGRTRNPFFTGFSLHRDKRRRPCWSRDVKSPSSVRSGTGPPGRRGPSRPRCRRHELPPYRL